MKNKIKNTNSPNRIKDLSLIKSAKISLIVLWITAIITLFIIIFWNSADKPTLFSRQVDNKNELFVDELLLSSSELGKNTMLINLNLNSKLDSNNQQHASLQQVIKPEVRKAVYNKIAERKVKKASSGFNTEGFTLKPVPE